MKHLSDIYKHYPGAKKIYTASSDSYCLQSASAMKLESQKTRKATLTMAHIHYLASPGHPGTSKHPQVNPARLHKPKPTSKSH